MMFTKYEEDYIEKQLDTEEIHDRAEAIYAHRLESSRHYEYQPVSITSRIFAGSRLIVEVEGHRITGIFLRNEVYT